MTRQNPSVCDKRKKRKRTHKEKLVTIHPVLPWKRVSRLLHTFAHHFVPRLMIAGAQHPSACKQRYLENVGDSWCVRDNTHAPTRQIFLCQRDALARKRPARSSRAARTLVTSSKSGSYVSLLCNFNNRILWPSRKMADHSKTECPATRRNPLPVAR